MQRWIVIGVIALVLAIGGGGYGVWNHRQNRPDKLWVPLAINPKLTADQQKQAAEEVKVKLATDEILTQVSTELALAEKWNLASPQEAAAELKQRLFVEPGEAIANGMPVPAIIVGVNGVRKEHALLGEISLRLMKEVWKIVGIKPAPGQGI